MIDDVIMKRIMSKTTSIDNFNFDNLVAPSLYNLLTVQDIEYFRYLATSVKYSAKINLKYAEIDKIMRARGFVKLSAGTNRVVYRYLEDQSFVVKIAIDNVGIKDNPREFINQHYFKPYVTKIFEVSPCGTVAVVERVRNIKSREEFMHIAPDIFDLLSNWFVGEYILEDVGTKYFMNWGVSNRGPVLLDFPYVYKLDGNKLYCRQIIDGCLCDGEIDYDDGFNHLYCTKCGTEYKAVDLKKLEEKNLIVKKGKDNMEVNVVIKRGNRVVKTSEDAGKRKISKRERIYKSLPAAGEGTIVHCRGGKLANRHMSEAVAAVKDEIKNVEETNQYDEVETTEYLTNESEYECDNNTQEDEVETTEYLTNDPECNNNDDTQEEDEVETAENEDENDFDTHSHFIPQEDDNESDVNNTGEERTYKEEHLCLDTTDDESVPDDEEPDYSKIPVGAIPVGQIKNNKRKTSQRYNPEFYKR